MSGITTDFVAKLNARRVRSTAQNLVESYTIKLNRCIRIDNPANDCLECKGGVPQGTVLGPLLCHIMNP